MKGCIVINSRTVYLGLLVLLISVSLGNGQAVLFSEIYLEAVSEDEKQKIQHARGIYGVEDVVVLRLSERSLQEDGDASFSLPGGESVTFRMEKSRESGVWKGRQNGIIKMSLRATQKGFTGYMYAGSKRFAIVELDQGKVVLAQTDMRFECNAED